MLVIVFCSGPQCGPDFVLGTGVAEFHHQYGNVGHAGIVCINGYWCIYGKAEEAVMEEWSEGPYVNGVSCCSLNEV